MLKNFRHTNIACYIGYATQALIITLPSLLYTVFYSSFGISFKELGSLIILTFSVQLLMDFSSAFFIHRTGYRIPSVFAHFMCFLGLALFSVLPFVMENKFLAVSLSVLVSSIGGGLIEVLVSPIKNALPEKEKASSMSFLHSFFCIGQLSTTLLSTLFFCIAGIKNWAYLPIIFSFLPLFNAFYFIFVPLPKPEEETFSSIKGLFKKKYLFCFLIIMFCSGAAEQGMSQWVSLFAEAGLKVSKTTGDLIGLSLFAALMGVSRLFYGLKGKNIDLRKFIMLSTVLCILSYFIAAFSPYPILSLIGCGICGLSVGIMWPGALSLATERLGNAASLFAMLALFGDLGCGLGPGIVGFVSDFYQKTFSSSLSAEHGLKAGIVVAAIFPIILLIATLYLKKSKKAD